MPTFILAGFQRSLKNHVEKAIKAGRDRFGDWQPVLMQGDSDGQPSISKKFASKILEEASKRGGAHVFGVDSRAPDFASDIREHFRFRRVSSAVIGKTGAGEFEPLIEKLIEAFEEEQYWIDNIKPKDYNSPLVLPRIFNARRDLRALWDQAESYNALENLESAVRMIEAFPQAHRKKIQESRFKKNPWVCERDWIWKDDGERHGEPMFPDDWKYSYQLEDGFHLDVECKHKTKTSFTDAAGNSHSLPKGYLNVTSQGWIRGDKPKD